MRQIPSPFPVPLTGADGYILVFNPTTGQYEPTTSTGFVSLARHDAFMQAMSHRVTRRRICVMNQQVGATTRTDVPTNHGAAVSGTSGSATAEADGLFQTWTTGAVSTNIAGGVVTNARGTVERQWFPVVYGVVRTSADLSSQRWCLGLWDNDWSVIQSDTYSSSGAVLCYSTVRGDSGWRVATRDGSSTTLSSAVANIATSTTYCFAIDFYTASQVRIWLGSNGDAMSVVHTATATLPALSTLLYPFIGIGTATAASRALSFGYMEVSTL